MTGNVCPRQAPPTDKQLLHGLGTSGDSVAERQAQQPAHAGAALTLDNPQSRGRAAEAPCSVLPASVNSRTNDSAATYGRNTMRTQSARSSGDQWSQFVPLPASADR